MKVLRAGISLVLSIILLIGVLCIPAAAEEDDALEQKAASTLGKILSAVQVEKNSKAGLDGTVNVALDWQEGSGILYLPGKANTKKLRLSWDDEDVTFSRNGTSYNSGEAPVAQDGKSLTYTVSKGVLSARLKIKTMKSSASVEPMFLELDESKGTIAAMDLDDDHETSCYGTIVFKDLEKAISLKGRGNSTWVFPKKPYNITFYKNEKYQKKKKAELIDGVKSKKWTLLSNYFDNTLLRNKLAQDLASDLGIGLQAEFVDLYRNGEYLGNYVLTPKKDYQVPDNGFVLENDHIPAEGEDKEYQFDFPNIYEMPLKHNRLNVDGIGDEAAAQGVDTAYIEKWFTKAWNTVLDTDSEEYQKYFDLDSWAKMYLMVEVSKTYDCYAGNIIMHRDGLSSKDKLYAGPAWDYDIAFGRTLHKFLVGVTEPMQLNAEGWYNDSIGFEAVDEPCSLLQGLGMHESFRKHVAKVYREYEWAFEDLDTDAAKLAKQIQKSAAMNNSVWGTNHPGAMYLVAPNTMAALGTGKYKLNYEITTTWDDYVRNLQEYCVKRVLWLSDNL